MSQPRRIMLLFSLLLSLTLAGCQPAAYPFAAVASAHPLATQAGQEILAQGGNAFDAAVAVSAALAVVEPYSSGLGGGGFWLLHQAETQRDIMIDGREVAPLQATRDMYLDARGDVIPGLSVDGPLAAAIPGAPAALTHLAQHYGRLPLAQSLAPAIRYARDGFQVSPHYQRMAEFRLGALRASPAAAEVFLLDNEVPPVGHVIRQPDLARVLEIMAAQGHAGFYQGGVARQLLEGMQAAGGIWSEADLTDYRVVEREPVVGLYRGNRIVSAAPPSSGGVALMTMLNILENYPLDSLEPAQRKHVIVEAMRRAYRDRAEYLGDPDFIELDVERLISPAHADTLRQTINMQQATPSASLSAVTAQDSGHHTSHFSILDRHGNRVAATLSINYPFGSGFMPAGTGVLLNDEMDDFSVKPGVPNVYGLVGAEANAIAPGKRMLSSMSPTFVINNERIAILGTPGGSRIISMVLHGILDVAEGRSASYIVNRPRYHHQYLPDVVQFEADALSEQQQRELTQRGHTLRQVDRPYGNMQVVIWDRKQHQVEAASDPRGEGVALVK